MYGRGLMAGPMGQQLQPRQYAPQQFAQRFTPMQQAGLNPQSVMQRIPQQLPQQMPQGMPQWQPRPQAFNQVGGGGMSPWQGVRY